MILRRILWLVAALLLVAAVTSALTPRQEDPATSVTLPPATAPGAERAVVDRRIEAGAGSPEQIAARVGDRVTLEVAAETTDVVSLDGLDRVDPVSPETPARFDWVASRPGVFPVILRDAGREVGLLRVSGGPAAGP